MQLQLNLSGVEKSEEFEQFEFMNNAPIKCNNDNNEVVIEKLKTLINKRLKLNGLDLLSQIPDNSIKATFFDPQYRGILDKMNYGNEGESREKRRVALNQMDASTIEKFIVAIDRVLMPSGHLFLWIDKFHLSEE